MGTKLKELVFEQRHVFKPELHGNRRTIGFDGNLFTHQNNLVFDYRTFTDLQGGSTGHLMTCFYRLISILKNGVRPIFVFDGPRHHLKAIREQNPNMTKEQHEKVFEETQYLISLFGIPVHFAIHDAEAELANMTKDSKIEFASTLDYDVFMFGGTNVLRHYPTSKKDKIIERIHLSEVLAVNKISYEQLIYIGIMTGTDFNEKVPRVGFATAYKIVKKFKTWGEIAEHIKEKYNTDYGGLFDEVYEYFHFPPNNFERFKPEWTEVQYKDILRFLRSKDFNEDRVRDSLKKLKPKMKPLTRYL